MNEPKHPLYVVSKGRSQYLMTSCALTAMGIQHFIVVEPQEADAYRAAVVERSLTATVLELDMGFKTSYELCDTLGLLPRPRRRFVVFAPWRSRRADSSRVTVDIGENENQVDLKIGQSFDRGTGEVRDSLDGGEIRINRRPAPRPAR